MPPGFVKLTRRPKGVTGAVREDMGDSSSSMAFSSRSEELLVDRLARRARPAALVGEVPMPMLVERERRRRCSMAALVMAPGMTDTPAVELLRGKNWAKAEPGTEGRRLCCMSAGGGVGDLLVWLALSEDMVTDQKCKDTSIEG